MNAESTLIRPITPRCAPPFPAGWVKTDPVIQRSPHTQSSRILHVCPSWLRWIAAGRRDSIARPLSTEKRCCRTQGQQPKPKGTKTTCPCPRSARARSSPLRRAAPGRQAALHEEIASAIISAKAEFGNHRLPPECTTLFAALASSLDSAARLRRRSFSRAWLSLARSAHAVGPSCPAHQLAFLKVPDDRMTTGISCGGHDDSTVTRRRALDALSRPCRRRGRSIHRRFLVPPDR